MNYLSPSRTLWFAACLLLVFACKKDEKTPAELLTATTCWKMTLLEGYDPSVNLWVAVPVEACVADNCFTFNSDQTFVTDEGASKCDPGDPQTAEGAWSLSDDGKKLSITDDGSSETGTLVTLTADKLSYELSIDSAKIRVTFRAN